MARMQKLGKKIEENLVTFTFLEEDGETMTEVIYDFNTLPAEIQAHLGPFGLAHKLGDAAASSDTAQDRLEAINRVYDALKSGDWSVRKAVDPNKEKTPKVTKKSLLAGLAAMSPEEAEMARGILAKLGMAL